MASTGTARKDAALDATDLLLSSIGASAANVDTYESSVLRQATLNAAPTLTGVGFPDLSPLAPSFDARRGQLVGSADAPHAQTLLSRVRTELSKQEDPESYRSLVLLVKEQILLSYLQNVANLSPDDMPVDPIREASAELKRSQQVSRTESTKKQKIHENITKMNGTAARSVASASATASFGKQALLERQERLVKRRVPLMRQKQLANQEPNPQDEELKKMLHQRRKERQERRRKRQQQWEISSDSEEEFTLDVDTMEVPSETNGATMEDAPTDVLQSSKQQLTCPLCEQVVEGGDTQEESDAKLSQHIQECQQEGRRTRRKTRTVAATAPSVSIARGSTAKKRTLRKIRKKPTPYWKEAVDDFDEEDYEDRVDDWIAHGRDRMRQVAERDADEMPPGTVAYPEDLIIPGWMNNRLFPYQRAGLRWMWDLHLQEAGGCMGDEMGLGKTVQVSAYLGAMAASRKLNSVLIIGPATMLQHWLTELSIWAPGLRRVLCHKSGESDGMSRNVTTSMLRKLEKWLQNARANRLYEAIDEEDYEEFDEDIFCGTGYVVVTTYESIRRSPDIWTTYDWSYVVLDEGQKIRNPDADVTIACKRMRTPHRLLLSGTPIQNDLRELWSLFDFVFPGRLGTLPAFEAEFADPIKRGGYSNASPMDVQLAYRCALMLRDLINPYLLRRQKKDLKEVSRMPGKTEQVLFCRLTSRQRALYEAFIRSDIVMSVLRGNSQLLGAVTTLRKICNHPDLVCGSDQSSFDSFIRNGFVGDESLTGDSSDDDDDMAINESMVERAGKLQVLAKILPLWKKQGHRVLIFCQWRKMLNIIQRFTELQGWKFGRLDGNTNVASRQRLVDTFNTDDSYFGMLLTTRTGGVGLNLTGADRIILYDPDWNPQTDAQARERAWRFGQKNPVTIYRLITAGTIEEKIYQRQIFKTALTNKVLQDPRQRRLFSQRDLRDFFTLKSDTGSVASGGYGLTETGEITKGTGVVDPDVVGETVSSDKESSEQDDVRTLQEVLKSKGLAGVFDHDVVDYSKTSKSSSVREMEQRAKVVARNAAKALKESTANMNRFEPTWTGSNETGSRFGGHSGAIEDLGHASAGVAGFARSPAGGGNGSSALLSNLKKRSNPLKVVSGDTSQYADLMKRIQLFVKQKGGQRQGGGPTTDEILKEFESVPNCDAAIFRRLLNSVAKVERGRWRLKS